MADPNLNNYNYNEGFNRKPHKEDEDIDMLVEQILENINTTPIGRLLRIIASFPEVRQEKVLNLRNQISHGKYDMNKRLDIALDKVLEEILL